MDIFQAMEERHSVREYSDKRIEDDKIQKLQDCIRACNKEGNMNIQLILDESKAFSGIMARYGKFNNVKNYIAMIGEKSEVLEEKCGYYGEKIVLFSQMLGLNTCWVGLSYKKISSAFEIGKNERLVLVIALGYGSSQGKSRKSKSFEQVVSGGDEYPLWFKRGVCYSLLAPTAINQQQFRFELAGDNVRFIRGMGPYSKVDMGIVKYHFEAGSGMDHKIWIK